MCAAVAKGVMLPVFDIFPVTFALPLKLCPQIVLVVANWIADWAAISDVAQVTLAEPLTDFEVPPMEIFLAVPQFAVVMFAVPLKDVPLISLAVCNLVAVDAFPASTERAKNFEEYC